MADENYPRLSCGCGNPLKVFASSGRVQIVCRECRLRRRSRPDNCVQCGAAFERTANHQRFCSTACTQAFHRPKVTPKPKRSLVECKGCSKTFKPKHTGNKGLYCSRECAFEHISQWKKTRPKDEAKPGPRCLVYFNTCKQCGKEWTARRSAAVCSERCRHAAANPVPTLCKCKECGVTFHRPIGTMGMPRKFCSDKCTGKYGARKHRQAYGNKYRHRARKAGVEYEPINLSKVFERDGWRCQVCGKDTPKARRGTRYSNAPELDHRRPFALGGPHLYSNVQCACRACNSTKAGTIVVGQLPLLHH